MAILCLAVLPGAVLGLIAFGMDWLLPAPATLWPEAFLGFVSPLPSVWLISGWSIYVLLAGIWPWFGPFLGCASTIVLLAVLTGQAMSGDMTRLWMLLVIASLGLLWFLELFVLWSAPKVRWMWIIWILLPLVPIARLPQMTPAMPAPAAPETQSPQVQGQ